MFDMVIFKNRKNEELGRTCKYVGGGLIIFGVAYIMFGNYINNNSRNSKTYYAKNKEAINDLSDIQNDIHNCAMRNKNKKGK